MTPMAIWRERQTIRRLARLFTLERLVGAEDGEREAVAVFRERSVLPTVMAPAWGAHNRRSVGG